MALGRRRDQFQHELMVPTSALPRSPGHPFYVALNKLLAEAKFDASSKACASHSDPAPELGPVGLRVLRLGL